jgi:LPS sulfotransferase NodH
MAQFDYFVVFAEMRTGSNLLEQNINQFDGLACYGEAFNPHFLGYPKNPPILGVTLEERDADPKVLLRAIRKDEHGLGGFRYFHDHDPRIFDKIVDDPRCAKIVLTRNPAESYVSWKIAVATGQWKLTDAKARKSAQAQFDADEFEAHVSALQGFQTTLLHRLQTTGQTAFYLAYEDLQDVGVMNGLAQFLGVSARLDAIDKTLKVQNPAPLRDKVENFEEMEQALSRIDRFNLSRTPNFEPRRGPAVPTWRTCTRTPLLYMPLRSRLDEAVDRWMAELDGVGLSDLGGKHKQGELRKWMRANKGHRSFTILRHPVVRAYDAFCDKILPLEGGFTGIRATLTRRYKLPLPMEWPDPAYDVEAHHAAFVAFLTFLSANLAEQTAVRVDARWASQTQCLSGFAEFLMPDRLIREDEAPAELNALAHRLGHETPPDFALASPAAPYPLEAIYDAEIERLARDAYARDYVQFGFSAWM